MKIVVLSNCGAIGTYVIQQVALHWRVSRILRPVFDTGGVPLKSSWIKFREAPIGWTVHRAGRFVRNRRNGLLERGVRHKLFGSDMIPVLDDQQAIPDRLLNHASTVSLLRSLQPDYLVLCGSPIVRKEILSVPKAGTLNVHLGIAPQYRGEYTLFWPLYFADYKHIGVTIHYVDEQVDTGSMIAQAHPLLEPADSEITLMAKCAKLAAQLLIEFFHAAEQAPVVGMPQAGKGRQFFARQRTLWHDLHYQFNRHVLRRRPPPRPASAARYFAHPESTAATR